MIARYYHNPRRRPLFNQSYNIVTIETDAGITVWERPDRSITNW